MGTKMIRISEDDLRSQLAEGMHTAFRKATDCPQAMPIWKLIHEMPDGEWGRTIDWVVWAIALNYSEQDSQELQNLQGKAAQKVCIGCESPKGEKHQPWCPVVTGMRRQRPERKP